MSTLDQGVQQAEVLTDNLSAIAAQNQQANRNSSSEANSAVQMTASSLSQQQATSQAQLYAATLGVQPTSSSSSQASSATALRTAAAATSANQRNIKVTNAQECCCEETKITISDLAVRYNYDDFARWQEPGYITIIGRITMDEPPDWDTVLTLKITNLSAPARSASFSVVLSAGISYTGNISGALSEWTYLDPPYTDVFNTTPTYCKQIEPPLPLCEDVSLLTQPLFCEVCKIEYVSAYQIVERPREFSSQYNGPGPYPYNQKIFPTVEGPDSTTESPGLLATVEICPYVGEFEFADTVKVGTNVFNSPYFSPYACSGYVGLLLKTLPTYGFINVLLKQSDGITITPEDPNPNDEIPAPSPYWVPGWIFEGTTNSDILNPNQSILWSWNNSEDFTLAAPTQTDPFDRTNGGYAGIAQISASDFSSNNYSTRFTGDWEFDVFEKKWVISTYDKYFTLDDSDQWQWVGPDSVDGYNWTEGQWVWSEDNENERQPSDPPPPTYAPTKSALPAPIVLPSEQVGYQDWAYLENAVLPVPGRENFKIYPAAASGGGFSSHTFPEPEDPGVAPLRIAGFTVFPTIPTGQSTTYYFDSDEVYGSPTAPQGLTYSVREDGLTVRFDCVEWPDCAESGGYTECAYDYEQRCILDVYWCGSTSQTFDYTVTGTAQMWPGWRDILKVTWFGRSGSGTIIHYSDSTGFPGCINRYDWPYPCENFRNIDPTAFQPTPFFPGAVIEPGGFYFWPPYLIGSKCAVRERTDIRANPGPYTCRNGVNRLRIDFNSWDSCNKRGVWCEFNLQLLGEP